MKTKLSLSSPTTDRAPSMIDRVSAHDQYNLNSLIILSDSMKMKLSCHSLKLLQTKFKLVHNYELLKANLRAHSYCHV